MNIELQVGKRYETRGGLIAEIASRNVFREGSDMEFIGRVLNKDGDEVLPQTCGWTREGVFDQDATPGALDIRRELPDASSTPEPAAEPEPVSDTQAPLRLEVGKWYRCRDGKVARIDSHDSKHQFGGKNYPFWSSNGDSYLSDGTYNHYDGQSQKDLIEEIPAPVAEAADTLDFKIEYESPTISAVRPEPPRMDASLTATEGPATEKVVLHWDREGVTGYTSVGQQPRSNADDAWLHANLADTRAGITRKYAQAAMFVMLGVAAIIFAIGTSVQV